MRRHLLASAAMTAAAATFTFGAAQAQTMPMTPSQGMMVTSPAASPPAGANNNNNTTAAAKPGAVANPTPGGIVVHVNGRVTSNLNAVWSSVDKFAGAKNEPLLLATYARIYTGLDAMTANGLRYGGAIEVRENFTSAASSSASTGASAYSSTQTLFFRRAFGYIANDNLGIVRVGQADGLISLFDNGITTFQFLPSGNLNGGDLETNVPSATTIPFAFMSVAGNEYDVNKIVYLTPQFAGIDAGIQWAPGNAGPNGYGIGTCATAATACPNLSSSPTALDGARILNQVDVGLRYQGSFAGVSILGYGVYSFSGHVNYTGPAIALGSTAARASSAGTGKFDNLSRGNIGLALTMAGFTIGGNWVGGAANGQGALRPSGGASQQGVTAGVKYAAGPMTVGAVWEQIDSQGAAQLAGISQRHEWAVSTGASYTIAPGMVGWAEYMYQQRHQGGFNFATGSGVAGSTAFNDVKSQGFQVGTTIYW